MPSNIALAEDWEGLNGIVGVEPKTYQMPTHISFEKYDLHYQDNTNNGALLYYWKIEPWDGSIPSRLANVGFTTACNYKMTVQVLFRVSESGLDIQAGVLNDKAQNVVGWVDISGYKLLYEGHEIQLVPQDIYADTKSFQFPNTLTSSAAYATNSRQFGIIVYPSAYGNFGNIYTGEYDVLGTSFEFYYYAASGSTSDVPVTVISKLEQTINGNPNWVSIGHVLMAAKCSSSDIGQPSEGGYIDDYISHMSVEIKGYLNSSALEHISGAQDRQDAILNGYYEDWLKLQEFEAEKDRWESQLNNSIVTNPIEPIDPEKFFINLDLTGGMDMILTSFFDNRLLISILSISASLGLISLVMYGTTKG